MGRVGGASMFGVTSGGSNWLWYHRRANRAQRDGANGDRDEDDLLDNRLSFREPEVETLNVLRVADGASRKCNFPDQNLNQF